MAITHIVEEIPRQGKSVLLQSTRFALEGVCTLCTRCNLMGLASGPPLLALDSFLLGVIVKCDYNMHL